MEIMLVLFYLCVGGVLQHSVIAVPSRQIRDADESDSESNEEELSDNIVPVNSCTFPPPRSDDEKEHAGTSVNT